MTTPGRPERQWTRRRVLLVASGAVGLSCALPCVAAAQSPILIVARKRLLNETAHARLLLAAEQKLTEELQGRVDRIKSDLAAEEKELAELRPQLGREEFDARVTAFDRRVRLERRRSQQWAAALQNAFRSERLKLVEAIGPLLEEVRADHGASLIINSDQAMAADPNLDITDEVIARFNATIPGPVVPTLESLEASVGNDSEPQ